jgi:peptidoglycan hydrolase-like protein with peptidoglycan-binding domain
MLAQVGVEGAPGPVIELRLKVSLLGSTIQVLNRSYTTYETCTTYLSYLPILFRHALSANLSGLTKNVSFEQLATMANPGQPTISLGATGEAVRRLQRALRRTPDPGIPITGVFDASLEKVVKDFQSGSGLAVDGIVGPLTWAALPDGGPMPVLEEGSSGDVVSSLQTVLTNGAPGAWNTTPQGIDGDFGPLTQASVKAFQTWGGVASDGIVGDQTWAVSLHAASATLESKVGLNFVIN